jgi:ferric-dicitrate binding protein FerR (iron transport regulator)
MNRDGITNVMLQEGSVTVRTKDGREVYMKPGDFVEVSDSSMNKKAADTGNIVAWKDRKMVFDNTTLQEAAHMIEAHYGVQVILTDSSVAAKTINGILSNDNLDVLLAAIEAASDVKVERTGNTIVIKNHS